jgi:bifunctional non-homologous end joining protein LigD
MDSILFNEPWTQDTRAAPATRTIAASTRCRAERGRSGAGTTKTTTGSRDASTMERRTSGQEVPVLTLRFGLDDGGDRRTLEAVPTMLARLIEYYRRIAPWMLPYLRDRPLVMTRFPDGITGKSFYQKDASGFAPEWLLRARVWSEGSEREIECFVADDEASLLYIANLGAIPIHAWASRVGALGRPDWCILDLDPKGAPFVQVVRVARALHRLCEAVGLPNYVKTSGSTGVHVLVPLGGQCTYEQSRTLGQLLAGAVVAELPTIATIVRAVSQRQGRVYVDYLQNRYGQLLAAPFSVRPLPGAPVSTPREWHEVHSRLDLRRHTMRTVPLRLARMARDPMRPVLADKPDLVGALERLRPRLPR